MKKAEKEIIEAYRRVFTSGAGRKVLGHMLVELNFFDEILNTEEERARSNYARKLLNRIGILNAENIPRVVDALLGVRGEEDKGDNLLETEETNDDQSGHAEMGR